MAKRKAVVRCGLCKHPVLNPPFAETTLHGTCHAKCVAKLYATN